MATTIGTAACVIACIGLCFPATDIGPYVGGIAYGFGTCMGTVAPPVVVARAFGKRDLGKINGIVVGFQLLGGAIGTVVSGIVFDACLTFRPVWLGCIVCALLMGVLICSASAWTHHKRGTAPAGITLTAASSQKSDLPIRKATLLMGTVLKAETT